MRGKIQLLEYLCAQITEEVSRPDFPLTGEEREVVHSCVQELERLHTANTHSSPINQALIKFEIPIVMRVVLSESRDKAEPESHLP